MLRKPFSSCSYSLLVLYLLTLCLFASCGSSRQASNGSKKQTSTPSVSKQDVVIAAARSYIGTPYKWGGTTRAGLDCSGLLQCSFRAAEMELPRTSAEQSKYGKRVSLYELQPGDLVFFSAKQGRGKITHVGLVTEVRSRSEVIFIHASSSLGVIENNLHSDYYRKIFVKAQRPF